MKEEKKPLVFIDREGKPGGGKGLLISKDLTFTLSGLRQNLLVWETEDDFHLGQSEPVGLGRRREDSALEDGSRRYGDSS